jgi:hypothetical protein
VPAPPSPAVPPPPEALDVDVVPVELVVVPVGLLVDGAPPAPPSPSIGPPRPVAQPTSASIAEVEHTRVARSSIEGGA